MNKKNQRISFVLATSIRNSMTVQQIFEKLQITNSSNIPNDGDLFNEDSENTSRQQFTALLYCIVTNYDLDGPEFHIISYKWYVF